MHVEHHHLRNRHYEPGAPLADEGHLLDDFGTQVPRKNQHVIRLRVTDRIRVQDGQAASRQEMILLVRAAIHRKVDHIRANAAEIQQRVALRWSAVGGDSPALPFRPDEELEKAALRASHLFRKGVVSRRFLETVPFLRNSIDFAFDTEILFQAVRFGFRIAEVPVETKYFPGASSASLRQSTVYGMKTLRVAAGYVLYRWKLARPAIFR